VAKSDKEDHQSACGLEEKVPELPQDPPAMSEQEMALANEKAIQQFMDEEAARFMAEELDQ